MKEKLCSHQAYFWFPNHVAISYILPLISSAISKTFDFLTRKPTLPSFVHSTSSPISQPLPLHLPPAPNFTFPDPQGTRETASPALKDCVCSDCVCTFPNLEFMVASKE